MNHQILQEAARTRRSVYALNKNLPLPAEEVAAIVEHAVLHTPSSFNSQSTRVVVLFGAEHEKLWQLTEAALRQIVPADKFEPTAQKLAGFAAAAGTVLFFEDQSVVRGLQEQFPAYAANFPVWTTFAAAGIGANLQHYNPVIDQAVAEQWQIPASWTLRAQLVFGGIATPAADKQFAPVEGRFKVHGL